MYTSFIGKKFLKAYNARAGTSLTARQFFDEVMFPVFFDDDRHLMHVANSPFFQSLSKSDLKSGIKASEIRRKNLHHLIATEAPNVAIYVGYAAKEIDSTTSGQVTNMPGSPASSPNIENTLFPEEKVNYSFKIETEEVYASWIGQGLAIGVSGGVNILADRDDLLLHIFEGWACYRRFLSQTPALKGRQIETWNGQWITHVLTHGSGDQFTPEYGKSNIAEGNTWAINTIGWTRLVMALCKRYPKEIMTINIYNLSQTNTTLGFFNLLLPEINRLFELHDKIFLDRKETGLTSAEVEMLQSCFSLQRAAEFGVIGLKALEPKDLRKYLPQKDHTKTKDFKLTEDTFTQFKIFKLWIYAMLNKTELHQLAGQVAQLLHEFEKSHEDRGKRKQSQLSNEVCTATSARALIDKLTEILALNPAAGETFRQVVENLMKLPADQLPLLVTLIRFEYVYLQSHQANN